MREFGPANEKVDSAVPGSPLEPTPFFAQKSMLSALRSRSLAAFGRNLKSSSANSFSKMSKFGKQNISGELRGLIEVLDAGLRRILLNTLLRDWASWWNWILIGLVVAASFIPKLAGATIAAAVLTIIGGTVVGAWTWRTRPSTYDVACRMDSVAGLHDRISTALYFGESAHPDAMIGRQRQDALARLRQLDARALFPIQTPAKSRRTLALVLAVAGLFIYRMYYRPPMIALLQTTARSRLVQSILTPFKQNAEDGPKRADALANQNAEAASETKRPEESAQPADDPWAPAKGAVAGQNAQGENSGGPNGDQSGKGTVSPSINQAFLDALKGMFANRPPPGGANGKPQDGQQANPNQANPGDGGDSRDHQQGPDSQQKNPQGTANGAGDQQAGTKELRKNTPLAVKAVPDRVPLQSVNLKDQPLIDVSAEAGTAKIAIGNASPQATAAVNGAEQENIPARYRSYVQRYFQHPDNGKQ